MIPSDVATSLRAVLPDLQNPPGGQSQPVLPAQRVPDALSNLVAGQRVLAEIVAQLPNGNYRAVVAQREITLALPFSAKAGDTLELEVTENNGRLTLAQVAGREGNPRTVMPAGAESVATSLSNTGRLIGNLLKELGPEGQRAPAAPLNGNRPLVDTMPARAAELVPVLAKALTQSGVFYEAHQARWVSGQLPTEALRQEPQGKLAPLTPPPLALAVDSKNPAIFSPPPPLPTLSPSIAYTENTSPPQAPPPDQPALSRDAESTAPPRHEPAAALREAGPPGSGSSPAGPAGSRLQPGQETSTVQPPPLPATPAPVSNALAPDTTPLVQQQLDALATQNFAWQGQVWPGQSMWWEISPDGNPGSPDEDHPGARWRTRLRLVLPALGGLDATLALQPGGEIAIHIHAESKETAQQLDSARTRLATQLETAGLIPTQILVDHDRLPDT